MDISSHSRVILERLFDEKQKQVLNVTNNLEKQLEGVFHSLDFISSQYDAIQQKYEKYEAMLKESCQENNRLKTEIFRLNRELKQATFLSTRTTTGSKPRRYRWRMIASAVLV